MIRHLKIIYRYANNTLQQTLSNLPVFFIFLVAKLLRYGLFMTFLYLLVSGVETIGGYTVNQMLLFYLVFNLIDTTAQLLFREVYRFKPLIVSGEFDFVLTKPMHPLVRSLLGGPDLVDLGMLVILISAIVVIMVTSVKPELISLAIFVLLLLNAMVIATALHIIVLGIGILSLSVDHLVMIYRDVTSLVRIPVDLYISPLRSILTFVIPVGIMFTFPAKAIFGLLSWQMVGVSFMFGVGSLITALKFWNHSLKQYQSASS